MPVEFLIHGETSFTAIIVCVLQQPKTVYDLRHMSEDRTHFVGGKSNDVSMQCHTTDAKMTPKISIPEVRSLLCFVHLLRISCIVNR